MSDPLAELLVASTDPDGSATWEYGTVTAATGLNTVTVTIGGSEVTVPAVPGLMVGQSVIILRQGKRSVAIGGTSASTPVVGLVTANGSSTVTCTVNGVTGLVMRYLASYTPTNGDSVWVLNGGVLGKFATAPAPPAAPAQPGPPPAAPSSGQEPFVAQDSDSYRSGWRGVGSVYQGSTSTGANSGAWFYGTSVQNRLAGAVCTRLQIWLYRKIGSGVYGAQTLHFWSHDATAKPGGDVTRYEGPYDGVSLAVEQSGWFDLPVDWGQNLIDGARRGVGITGNPYLRLAGLNEHGQSGTLLLDWRR